MTASVSKFLWVTSLLFFVLLLKVAEADIASDSLRTYYLGEVVVTAKRSPASLTTSLREVTKEEMTSRQIQTVAEAIQTLPGGYVSIGARNEMSVQLRGIEQRQVAVLLDGVPIYVPYDGVVDLGEIPMEVVEKITVTAGNASVLYGPNSLGGTINIISKSPGRLQSHVQTTFGSGNLQVYSLGGSGTVGSFGYLLTGSYRRQDHFRLSDDFPEAPNEDGDYRNNSDYEKFDFLTKLSWRPNNRHHTALTFSHLANKKGLPPKIYDKRPRFWRFPEWRKWVLNLTTSQTFDPGWFLKGTFFYDKYDNILDSYDDDTYTTQNKRYAFHSVYDDYSTGFNLYVTKSFSEKNDLTLGAGLKRDVHRDQPGRGESFEWYEIESYNLGLEEEWTVSRKLALSGGLSFNLLHPIFAEAAPLRDDMRTLDGRLGAHLSLTETMSLFGSVGKKTRFPTLKELYSGYAGRNVPNPDLKEESTTNMELGFSVLWGHSGRAELVLFDSEITNLIVDRAVIVEGEEKEMLDNIGKARHLGIELAGSYSPAEDLSLSGSYTYVKAENRSPGEEGDELPYRPQHRILVGIDYTLPTESTLRLNSTFTGERSYFDRDDKLQGLPGYLTVDLLLRQHLGEYLSFSLSLYNLFDEYYESEYGIPMPGRNFSIGIEMSY
ncbi:MAG: TonB-dependent receptor plug domain-containing protein [Candidatus Zixiibacteriota bacterium]